MTGEPIKLTFALTRDAHQALHRAAEITGHNRTDTINRALVLYEAICASNLNGGGRELTVEDADGTVLRLAVFGDKQTTRNPRQETQP